MTKGDGGNPNTIEHVDLEKFAGINLNQPAGTFGQPIALNNIYLDKRGGYTTAPGNVEIIYYQDKDIRSISPFLGRNYVFVNFFTASPSSTESAVINISNGGVVYAGGSYPSVASYKSGIFVSWDYNRANGGIIVFTVDFTSIINGEPTVNTTEINARYDLAISFADAGQYASGGTAGQPLSYQDNSLIGFDPQKQTFVFLYVQDTQEPPTTSTGTTLNPSPLRPKLVYPAIYRVGKFPNGMLKDYKIVLSNPNNYQVIAFGIAAPTRRTFEEFRASAQARVNNGAYPANKTVTYNLPIDDGYQITYQSMNAGTLGPAAPDPASLPSAYGSTFSDGDVVFVSLGPVTMTITDSFPEWLAKAGNAPIGYASPGTYIPELEYIYGDFQQLQTTRNGNNTEIWRSAKEVPDNFEPASFFPLGGLTESHLGRTWVVPNQTWRVQVNDVGGANVTQIQTNKWEQAKQRKTVYYSEVETPWLFLERFIVLPLTRSINIQAVYSIGDYLFFLGDADGVVLSGDSEANFYAKGIDIPGGYSQELGLVFNGTLYYRGVGGIYRLTNGAAERISDDVAPLIPDALGDNEAVSRDDTHIHFQMNPALTLTYDTVANAWTTQDTGTRFANAGEVSLNFSGGSIYKMTGTPNRAAFIQYESMELGSKHYRLNLRSVSMYVDGSGDVGLQMQAHTQKGMGPLSPNNNQLVNQRGQFMQWRFRDVQGQSFDMSIRLVPSGSEITVKPGISLEVYKGEVMRRGYDG